MILYRSSYGLLTPSHCVYIDSVLKQNSHSYCVCYIYIYICIRSTKRIGRKQRKIVAWYSPSVWNVMESTLSDDNRTNNLC